MQNKQQELYTFSEFVKVSGLFKSTLREYWNKDILKPKVNRNGKWYYTEDQLDKLKDINAGLTVGYEHREESLLEGLRDTDLYNIIVLDYLSRHRVNNND